MSEEMIYESHWYAIARYWEGQLQTRSIYNSDYDPLYGYGTWSLLGGPYETVEEADFRCVLRENQEKEKTNETKSD